MRICPVIRICTGDLLFQILDSNQFEQTVSQSYAQDMQDVKGAIIKGAISLVPVNHVALVIDSNKVIEASFEKGVVMTSIADYLARSKVNIVARIQERARIAPAIHFAKTCLGQPYNASFYTNHAGFYCSELITEAFTDHLGNEYFFRHAMNFKITNKIINKTINKTISSDDFLPFWKAYYAMQGLAIPQNMLGSHPAQLLQQSSRFSLISRIFDTSVQR